MNEQRCDTVRDALPALARDRLDSARAAGVRRHLAGCADCRAELELVSALATSQPHAPDGLAERVSAGLAARGATTSPAAGPSSTTRPWRRRAPWLAVGLAAAAVIALVLAWPRGAERTPEPVVATAAADRATSPEPLALADPDEGHGPVAPDFGVGGAADWPGANGVVGGSVTLDDLSYEQMEALLKELES